MNKDIHTLISNIAERDINALGELYDMMSFRIFNYARTIVKNKEMAEDITHDVFLQINKQAVRIAKTTDPFAYIMTMTRNHSYNLIKRGNQITDSSNDVFEISDDSSPYNRLLFADAFSGLPANRRETVYLHLICGFSFKEVAKMQNAPKVTVKWRYSKALSQLQAYFIQDNEEGNYNATY